MRLNGQNIGRGCCSGYLIGYLQVVIEVARQSEVEVAGRGGEGICTVALPQDKAFLTSVFTALLSGDRIYYPADLNIRREGVTMAAGDHERSLEVLYLIEQLKSL